MIICLVCQNSWPRPKAHSWLADSIGSVGDCWTPVTHKTASWTWHFPNCLTIMYAKKWHYQRIPLLLTCKREVYFWDIFQKYQWRYRYDSTCFRIPGSRVANPLSIARGSTRQHKLSCPPCYHLPIYCHAIPTALSATLSLSPSLFLFPSANPL